MLGDISVLYALVFGIICYAFAKERNLRYPILWALAGAIFSVLVILIIATINKKVKKTAAAQKQ